MEKLKPCPFCGGKARLTFKDLELKWGYGIDRARKYRVQAICNRCYSRGRPVKTDFLLNCNPWHTDYAGCCYADARQTEMVRPWAEKAIEAWNRRVIENV